MASSHRPLSLFVVVLLVFLGKEGTSEMLTGRTNEKELEIDLQMTVAIVKHIVSLPLRIFKLVLRSI